MTFHEGHRGAPKATASLNACMGVPLCVTNRFATTRFAGSHTQKPASLLGSCSSVWETPPRRPPSFSLAWQIQGTPAPIHGNSHFCVFGGLCCFCYHHQRGAPFLQADGFALTGSKGVHAGRQPLVGLHTRPPLAPCPQVFLSQDITLLPQVEGRLWPPQATGPWSQVSSSGHIWGPSVGKRGEKGCRDLQRHNLVQNPEGQSLWLPFQLALEPEQLCPSLLCFLLLRWAWRGSACPRVTVSRQ